MAALPNRELEKLYFNLFQKHYILPEGKIVYDDKPDVIVRGKRTVGIEITNFYLKDGAFPESEQVQARARHEVVDLACSLYKAKKSTNAKFHFGFEPTTSIGNKRKLAGKIAAWLLSLEPLATGELRKSLYSHIPELSFVYYNGNEYENAKWDINQVHSTPLMSLERLRKIIKEKEEKSKSYRRCDAYWLLVVVDFTSRAQDQEIRLDKIASIRSEIFEKIIVFKTHFWHIVEINRDC